jgi:uncharacterized phage infection (PIP) family protein YhgE
MHKSVCADCGKECEVPFDQQEIALSTAKSAGLREDRQEQRTVIEENIPEKTVKERFRLDLAEKNFAVIKEAYQEAKKTVETAKEAVETVKSAAESARKTVETFKNVAEEIERGEGTLGKLIKDESLYQEAKETMQSARDAVQAVKEIAEKVEKGGGTLGKLVNDDQLMKQAEKTLRTGSKSR